ncbi:MULTISPECIES: M15 family metallopeptidase [Prauserella salsuginis group]|uniref:D-alanyl-D-alanine dipeptidase n=2 Tax=Prauserella salsuginis group TaxID=2893672 RepID=A0A839XLR7_9PSEU|nr:MULTISPECIES: M15 family metallopeptidase [Prauserella salsuginis group]MBB3662769.1 D-alanyl-D-alanine dipeptidase [Prauserella sediminis]MCR3720465.1 D-alanyl-D-alanine dipeptidase [Prauserella flava]MCR3733825.1 D-alanyl-D-alanine dipeptidase [Prauserella salsuginis]
MSDVILMSDPRVAAVPVDDCDEPLVDVGSDGEILVDDRRRDPAGDFRMVRRGVHERIHHAQRLLPAGMRFLFVEGYRPPSLQRRHFEEYAATLATAQPDLSGDQLHAAASRYVSPPEIAPHSAGAAVDLTLADAEGRELDLGTRVNANPEESSGACYMAASSISDECRTRREVLAAALTGAGLVNYATEWWHWSYGDRYWALTSGAPAAVYGPA